MKAIFLDRDGVINQEVGYLHKIEDFKFIDGVFEACRYFQAMGYKLLVVTNQSGIARGYYKERDFCLLTQWMCKKFSSAGVNILEVLFCPHGPDSNCMCRKPKPGMLLEASDKYDIDLANSWMIGDKETDLQAANVAGISNTILVKSGHGVDEENSSAKFIVESIKDSIKIIKR